MINMIQNKKLVIAKDDLDILSAYIEEHPSAVPAGKAQMVMQLMQQAQLVEDSDFPWEVVRLNSKVIIRDKIARLNYSYTVVMPDYADHKQCRVSVFSEIGSALMGNSRGDDIQWKSGTRSRYFTIMAVSQFSGWKP